MGAPLAGEPGTITYGNMHVPAEAFLPRNEMLRVGFMMYADICDALEEWPFSSRSGADLSQWAAPIRPLVSCGVRRFISLSAVANTACNYETPAHARKAYKAGQNVP